MTLEFKAKKENLVIEALVDMLGLLVCPATLVEEALSVLMGLLAKSVLLDQTDPLVNVANQVIPVQKALWDLPVSNHQTILLESWLKNSSSIVSEIHLVSYNEL